MSTLFDVHARMRDYLSVIPNINKAEYPAPNSVASANTIVVYAGAFDLKYAQEMYLTGTSRAVLYLQPTDTPAAISRADDVALAIVDQFAPGTTGFNLDGLVDFCNVSRIELSQIVNYAGHEFFGATFYFSMKIRRFANGALAV
jgi:hypothetical protein